MALLGVRERVAVAPVASAAAANLVGVLVADMSIEIAPSAFPRDPSV